MPDKFSRFIVYVDESGDYGPISPDFPIFVLAFCIFDKNEYASKVTPYMHRFKFKYFGHDGVVLHEREIRKAKPPFSLLQNKAVRDEFMGDVSTLVEKSPFVLVATIIDKVKLAQKYAVPENPYHLPIRFGLERIELHRREHGQPLWTSARGSRGSSDRQSCAAPSAVESGLRGSGAEIPTLGERRCPRMGTEGFP